MREPRRSRRHRAAGVRYGCLPRPATRTLVAANVRATLEARAKAVGKTLAAADVEPLTRSMAELGRRSTAADYARSVITIHGVGRVVARFFAGYDILLTPTMCSPPWPLGVLLLSTSDTNAYLTALNCSIGFTSGTHVTTRLIHPDRDRDRPRPLTTGLGTLRSVSRAASASCIVRAQRSAGGIRSWLRRLMCSSTQRPRISRASRP